MKTSDKTTIKPLCWAGLSMFSNTSAVDTLDGKIVRIRPIRYADYFDVESSRPWKLEKDGHVLDQGAKSLIPPFSIAYKKRAYSKNRIPYPLKRVDWDPNGERNPQNRGKSGYERISWDEALEIVTSEIHRMHETYGHAAILCQGDGHNENKVYSGSHGNNIKMFSLMPEDRCVCQMRNPDSWEGWYWGAEHAWGMEPVGQPIYCNNLFKDIMENGDALIVWGGDPETTTWGWTGQQPSRICYWLTDIGVKQIYVCPDVNYAAAIHADKWFPVLPNTDSAMQLAIAYVWMTEGTYDQEYLDTHSVGYDWFEYYVLGEEDGIPKTPEWAEDKCGIPAYRIKALARYWASHNCSTGHCNGGSYIRAAFSHEPARLEVYLLAMQALGHPGRNYVKFLDWTLFGMPTLYPLPCAEVLPSLGSVYHGGGYWLDYSFIPKTLIPKALMDPPVSWYGHSFTGLPARDQFYEYHFPWTEDHPRIHMIWTDNPCWETCWNGGYQLQEALTQEIIETIVIQHPWMENDCLFADILLPVSTILEEDDVSIEKDTGQFTFLYKSERAIDRLGEAKSDFEIVWQIAKKLEETYGGVYDDLFQKFTEGQEDYDYAMKVAFENSSLPEVNPEYTFEDFMSNKVGVVPTKENWEDDPAGMIDFYNDPEGNPLTTPTGKIEFYSSALAHYFPDDEVRGPVAKWIEEGDGHEDRVTSERAKDYPFLLVSNHPRWRFHAQLDDVPWIREIETSKVMGPDGYAYEPVWINPQDAEALGVKTGDVVSLFNERGSVLGGAYVTERIRTGVVLQDHGARVDVIVRGDGGLDRGGANNLIAPSPTTSKNCVGEVTSGYLVGVEKVDPFALAEQYPEEFGREYDAGCGLITNSHIVKGA